MRSDDWDARACSVLGDALDEPAYGTASVARGWVALEQPGPWGRDAATESHLAAATGQALAARLKGSGGRFVLIRRAGPHADDHHRRPHTVLVSSALPDRPWLLTGALTEPGDLLDLDVSALARGDRAAVRASLPSLVPSEAPVFLVCTNGRRDVCCAVRGRPVAEQAAAARPGQVWETSHTGGHRFAPTGVLLPSGLTLARLDAGAVVTALDAAAAGEAPASLTGPRHDRGRSALSPVQQVAESAVRHATGETRLSALQVAEVAEVADAEGLSSPDGSWRVVVQREGCGGSGSTTVVVRRTARQPDRPVSCGKPDEPQHVYDAEVVGPVDAVDAVDAADAAD